MSISETAAAPPNSKYWNDKTRGLLLFALAFLIYGFGIGRGFDFDDPIYISQNALLGRPDAFHTFWFTSEAANYYPLFWSLLRVQWLLWGVHPLGYHLVNLVMHSVNAVLLWRIAREWRLPGAWWVAALFAVHPVNVQTLAWAAEQKNTWSFFFMALALLAFIRHARDRQWSQYALSLLWFVAALACKTSTVFLPVFLTVIYVFNREKVARAMLLRLVPFYALGLAAGVTTMWFEKHRVEAHSLLNTLSLWQRLETAGATFWFYLGKALVPVNLTPMYRGWVDTTAAAHTMIPGLLLVALLLACAVFWRRIGAPIALGITFYALMLLPLLGIFDTNYFAFSLVADHWQYHALPGILVAVVAALQRLAQHWPRLAAYPQAIGGLAVVGVAALASAHFAHFENPRSLWSYVVAQNPDAWLGWYNLGNVYADDQQPTEAIDAYRRSIRLRPHYFRSHFNLANSLFAQSQIAAAELEYFAAEKINLEDPAPHNNRASALLSLHREDEAMVEFACALKLDPSLIPPHINLITILLPRGRLAEAAQHLKSAGPLSLFNAHRVAVAITESAQTASAPSKASLRHFAQLACELNADRAELKAALTTLEVPPATPSPTPSQ
ncbi:MAG: tetratricopeptide repeat protein [Chthoniobacter sp.]|uniref:tetratricopeptide repeat protein n=1 Tax=Chthoniobacter sp. TaxID=2510640 RepID=UPI0032A2CD55